MIERRRLAWTVLAVACTSGTPEAERLEVPESEVQDDAEAPKIPDDPLPKRGAGKCVDAPFPEVKPPPDEGSTMTTTAKSRTFGKVTCMGGREVWLRPGGELDVCTIAKPMTLFGLALAGENYTHFHRGGRPEQTTLAKAHTLKTKAGVEIECAAEFVSLSDAGDVEHCTLEREQTFGETRCKRGESIALRPETGALWSCTIDGSLALKGATIVAGSQVSWHEGGAIASVYSSKPLVLDGIAMRYEVELHPDGTLAHFTLDENRTIGGIALEPFAKVWFYADGSPWHIEYVADRGFMVHGEPWTDTRRVTFGCDGSVTFDHTEHYQAPTRPRPPRGLD